MTPYNVFISYKATDANEPTRDSAIASIIFHRLEQLKNVVPFFAPVVQEKSGISDFGHNIDYALDSAQVLVYVCTNPSYLDHDTSKYVSSEINTFINEMRSGRKPNAKIFGIIEDVSINDLPIEVRQYQTFSTSEESIAEFLTYIQNIFLPVNNGSSSELENWRIARIEEIKMDSDVYIDVNAHSFIEKFFSQEQYNKALIVLNEYNNGTLLEAEAIRYSTQYPLFYFRNIEEVQNVFKKYGNELIHKTDCTKIPIFIDDWGGRTNLEKLDRLLEGNSQYKIITITNDDKYLNVDYPDILETSINSPSTDQLNMLIYEICQRKDYPYSNDLLRDFSLPINKPFRSPLHISIIIEQLKASDISSSVNQNGLLFYRMLDEYLFNLDSSIAVEIIQLVKKYIQKRINIFSVFDFNKDNAAIQKLIQFGILESRKSNYAFSCDDFLMYEVANYSVSEMGNQAFQYLIDNKLETALPYCITFINDYCKDSRLNFELAKKLEDNQLKRLILIYLRTQNIYDLISQTNRLDLFISVLQYYVDMGNYEVARVAINNFGKFDKSIYKNEDVIELLMFLNYEIEGKLDDCKLESSVYYWYHKGIIYYNEDNYSSSIKSFEKAIALSNEDNTMMCKIIFNLSDVLSDGGHWDDLNSLYLKYDHGELHDQLIRNELYYITKGNLELKDCRIESAASYYGDALNNNFTDYKSNVAARIYGNLGLVDFYQGNPSKAEKNYISNYQICVDSDNYNGIAISRMYLALLYLSLGRYQDAYAYASAALFYATKSGNQWRIHQISLILMHFEQNFEKQVVSVMNDIEAMTSIQYQSDTYILLLECMMRCCVSDQICKIVLRKSLEKAKLINSNINCSISESYDHFLNSNEYTIPLEIHDFVQNTIKLIVDNYIQKKVMSVNQFILPFSKYKELESERLFFKHISKRYAEGIFRYSSRQQPTRYVLWERHRTIFDTYRYINHLFDLELTGEYMLWVLIEKDSGEVIGTIDIDYEDEYQGVEFGIILSDFYWRKHYATEAINTVEKYLRDANMSFHEILGICVEGNTASQKMLINNGFIYDKRIENYHHISNDIVDAGLMYKKSINY